MMDVEKKQILQILEDVNNGKIKAFLLGDTNNDTTFLLSNGWVVSVFYDNNFPDELDYLNGILSPTGHYCDFWPEKGGSEFDELRHFFFNENWNNKLDFKSLQPHQQ